MMSLTQSGNAVALAGLLSEILSSFGVAIVADDISKVIIAVGIVISWIGRYRKGDLTVLGFRKDKHYKITQ